MHWPHAGRTSSHCSGISIRGRQRGGERGCCTHLNLPAFAASTAPTGLSTVHHWHNWGDARTRAWLVDGLFSCFGQGRHSGEGGKNRWRLEAMKRARVLGVGENGMVYQSSTLVPDKCKAATKSFTCLYTSLMFVYEMRLTQRNEAQ